jgi:hypothetical protein
MSSSAIMRRMISIVIPFCFLSSAFGQSAQQSQTPLLQQKLQGMQQAAARSQQQLRTYQWIESTTLTIDGKAKQPKQSICHYSVDGHLVKSPVGEPADPQISGGRLKQHIVKKKIEEFRQEITEVSGLTALYLPLNSQNLQGALHTRRVDLEHDQMSGTTIIVNDYAEARRPVTHHAEPRQSAGSEDRCPNIFRQSEGYADCRGPALRVGGRNGLSEHHVDQCDGKENSDYNSRFRLL